MNPLYFNFTITLFISSWVLYTFVYIKLHEMEIMIELPLWTFHFLLYDFFFKLSISFPHSYFLHHHSTNNFPSLFIFFSYKCTPQTGKEFFSLCIFLLLLLPYHCRRLVAKNKLKFMIGLCTEASFVHIEQKSNC